MLMHVLILVMALHSWGPDSSNTIEWLSLTAAVDEALEKEKPILVYVHAPWCGPCLQMERDVFPEVKPLLNRFALAGLNFDDNESLISAFEFARSPFEWATYFKAESTPTFILITPDGSIITRVAGYIDTQEFSVLLAYIATNAYKHSSFEDYATRIK